MLPALRLFGIVCAVVLPLAPAAAQGWIEPTRPLPGPTAPRRGIEKVRSAVQVAVVGRVARVTVEEWFRNTGALLDEGNYLYPLPGEAVFSDFSARDLRGDRAPQARSRPDRARGTRVVARAGVSHRPGRDAQDHVALYPDARSCGRRVALPVHRRERGRGGGVRELPDAGGQRRPVRRSLLTDASTNHEPQRPPHRAHARGYHPARRPRTVPAAGADPGRDVARHEPAGRGRRVLHAATRPGACRDAIGAPRSGCRPGHLRLHVG